MKMKLEGGDAHARGKEKMIRNLRGMRGMFSSGKARMEEKKKEMRTKKAIFAPRSKNKPNQRQYMNVSSTVPLFKRPKGIGARLANKLDEQRVLREQVLAQSSSGNDSGAQKYLADQAMGRTGEVLALKAKVEQGLENLSTKMNEWEANDGRMAAAEEDNQQPTQRTFNDEGVLIAGVDSGMAEEDEEDEAAMNHATPSGPALIEAAENGDQRMLRHCLLAGIKPTVRNEEGVTALSLAAKYNRLQSAVLLTSQQLGKRNDQLAKVLEAKSKSVENLGCTALHEAAQAGHVDMSGYLINRGSNVDAQDAEGRTPMMLACKTNHISMCAMLLEAQASTEVKDTQGMTAMHYAARHGDTQLVDLLLRGGARTLTKDVNDEEPATHAYKVAHDIRKTNQLKGGHNRTVTGLQLLDWHYEQWESNNQATRHLWIDKNPGNEESTQAKQDKVKEIMRLREIDQLKKRHEHEHGGLKAAQAAVRLDLALHSSGSAWQSPAATSDAGQWQVGEDESSAAAEQWRGGWGEGGDAWAEAWDESSGTKYYYNSQTGESRWEVPEEWRSSSPSDGW
jgi:ankyrin repeat protein